MFATPARCPSTHAEHQLVAAVQRVRQERPLTLDGQALPLLRIRQQELRLAAYVHQKANHLRRIAQLRGTQGCRAAVLAGYFFRFVFHAYSSIFS